MCFMCFFWPNPDTWQLHHHGNAFDKCTFPRKPGEPKQIRKVSKKYWFFQTRGVGSRVLNFGLNCPFTCLYCILDQFVHLFFMDTFIKDYTFVRSASMYRFNFLPIAKRYFDATITECQPPWIERFKSEVTTPGGINRKPWQWEVTIV